MKRNKYSSIEIQKLLGKPISKDLEIAIGRMVKQIRINDITEILESIGYSSQ